MMEALILGAVVVIVCVVSNKLLYRFGIPALLIFLALGMLLGSDGLNLIYFDDYGVASNICSIALIFIMFYGGFSTNWKVARPVAGRAILMSTLGVILTAALTGLFCHFILKVTLLEGLLIGSVVASTDAASVFSILRSRKLGLKGGLASLLELESGSNDPVSYMLTMVVLTLMSTGKGEGLWAMLLLQVGVGVAGGFLIGKLFSFILKKIHFEVEGLYPLLVTAVVILSYALCSILGGNGYLCVYLVGIMLGNSKIMYRRMLVHFFDGISWLMQLLLFFMLGLLCFPSMLPGVLVSGVLVSLFMILVARPAATFGILSWFRMPFRQQLFVSWVGLRGAASIAFAIFAVTFQNITIQNDIFHMVFFVALFSVAFQGTLIPFVARKLDLTEEESSIFRTFTDYEEQYDAKLTELAIAADHPWAGKQVIDAGIPDDILIVMIRRKGCIIVPNGSTEIRVGDTLVLGGEIAEEKLLKSEKEEIGSQTNE